MPLKKLPLQSVESRLHGYTRRLRQELRAKGLSFSFHLWVSDEWFCPDGVPGIAMPFYLFHPDLMNIERNEMGWVEGESESDRMRLLRHELGHCIDNAFRLRRNQERQSLFGPSTLDYPESYFPKPYSRAFVDYLGDHYSQSHPDEDFAETFALWLDPDCRWRDRYQGTKAYEKLLFMDELMASLKGRSGFLKNQFRIDPVEKLNQTLRAHYKERHRQRSASQDRLEQEILRFFSPIAGKPNPISVGDYLKKERRELCRQLAERMGAYQYMVEFAVDRTIERAKSLNIHGTKEQLEHKTPLLIERNFRYLLENQQIKYYL